MDFRLHVTLSGHGHDEEAAERLLDGFVEAHPEVGPVVSQNSEADTLTVVYSLNAENLDDAWSRGWPIFVAGAEASGLGAPDAIEINVAQVSESEVSGSERELQPA